MTNIHTICEAGNYDFELKASEDDINVIKMFLLLKPGSKELIRDIIRGAADDTIVLDDTKQHTIKY